MNQLENKSWEIPAIMSGSKGRALFGMMLVMPLTGLMIIIPFYCLFHWINPAYLIRTKLAHITDWYMSEGQLIVCTLIWPVLAFCLNADVLPDIRFETTNEKCDCRVAIQRSWINLAVLFLSTILIATVVLVFLIFL